MYIYVLTLCFLLPRFALYTGIGVARIIAAGVQSILPQTLMTFFGHRPHYTGYPPKFLKNLTYRSPGEGVHLQFNSLKSSPKFSRSRPWCALAITTPPATHGALVNFCLPYGG